MFAKPMQNFIYSFIIVAVSAVFASYFNNIGMDSFYSLIKLSDLTPPNHVFPIVWAVLYVLLINAFYLILMVKKPNKTLLKAANFLFIGSMFLQALWCYVFFACTHFLAGLAVIIVLDVLTLVMMEIFYKLRRAAGIMLFPYLMWLFFASYLNWVVIELNGIVYVG